MPTIVHYMIEDWATTEHSHKHVGGALFRHVHSEDPQRAHHEHEDSGYVENPPPLS